MGRVGETESGIWVTEAGGRALLNDCRVSVQSDGKLWKQVVVIVIAQLSECLSCQGSISLSGTLCCMSTKGNTNTTE